MQAEDQKRTSSRNDGVATGIKAVEVTSTHMNPFVSLTLSAQQQHHSQKTCSLALVTTLLTVIWYLFVLLAQCDALMIRDVS